MTDTEEKIVADLLEQAHLYTSMAKMNINQAKTYIEMSQTQQVKADNLHLAIARIQAALA